MAPTEYTDLTGVPMSVINCSPEDWAQYEQELTGLGFDLFTDFRYTSSRYPGCILAVGADVDLMELGWLEDHGFTVNSDSFRYSNQPSRFM